MKPLKRYQYERYAVLCNLAYQKEFKQTHYGFDADGQTIIRNQFGKIMIRILWSEQREEAIVVIKGSHSVHDWLLNFLMWPTSCTHTQLPYRIHYGYWVLLTQRSQSNPSETESEAQTVLEKLQTEATRLIQSGKRITVTGHSSGGAIGCVFADYLHRRYPKSIKRVVTFGQPAIGDWQFKHHYQLHQRTYRICCDLDIVTFMPPIPLLYSHVGKMLWLYNGRIYENTPTLIRLGRSLLSWLVRPFSYHLMSKYIRNKDFFDQR